MGKSTEELPPEPKAKPDTDAIIEMLAPNGVLAQAEKKASEAMSATGKEFQKIEKNFNGNRAAVSMIRRMQKMSEEKLSDFIRTLEPLMVHFGFTLESLDPDLFSQLQNEDGGGEEERDQVGAGNNSALNALDKARARLSGADVDEPGKPVDADDVVKGINKEKSKGGASKLSIVTPTTETKQ